MNIKQPFYLPKGYKLIPHEGFEKEPAQVQFFDKRKPGVCLGVVQVEQKGAEEEARKMVASMKPKVRKHMGFRVVRIICE